MGTVETVKIVSKDSEQGYLVINKSDLTNRHELFVEKKVTKREIPPVMKRNKK